MDGRRISGMGWRARVALQDGLKRAYQDFLKHSA
jgi:nucleoside-diphosphate-sugar epimerase